MEKKKTAVKKAVAKKVTTAKKVEAKKPATKKTTVKKSVTKKADVKATTPKKEVVISVKNLVKRYGKNKKAKLAVNNVSFDVYKGEFFGFLGQNGAGKSTTINMITTMLEVTEGTITLNGNNVSTDVKSVRNDIGIVFQQQTLDELLTASENLKLHGILYGIEKELLEKKIDEVLHIVNLVKEKNLIVKSFSGGMKRRLEIARALMHAPKVLFLDEPTTGLDPKTRMDIWTYLRKIQKETQMTIFLTTHYMDEADACDRIGIMDEGKLIEIDTPSNLKTKLAKNVISCIVKDPVKAIAASKAKGWEVYGQKIKLVTAESPSQVMVRMARGYKGQISEIRLKRPTMDDVFLTLTGKEIGDK